MRRERDGRGKEHTNQYFSVIHQVFERNSNTASLVEKATDYVLFCFISFCFGLVWLVGCVCIVLFFVFVGPRRIKTDALFPSYILQSR